MGLMKAAMMPRDGATGSLLANELNNLTRDQTRTQFQLQQKSCVTPLRDRSQVVPQWHKQLFNFRRIRCTICSTSPENHQKQERPHLKGMCLPATSFMVMCRFKSLSYSEKIRFLVVRNGFTLVEKQFAKVHRDNGNGGTS